MRRGVRAAVLRRGGALVAALVVASAVTGCQRTARPDFGDAAPRAPAQPGYRAAQHHAVTSIHETWTLGGEPVEVVVERPAGHGSFPLIVYLPGLGEAPTAGPAWRRAWAQAGYVVVAYQPQASGETVWTSASARRGEVADIAREQFSATALAKRLALLRAVLDDVPRRKDSAALQGIDSTRVALAGFELGAQTVMAAAGESDSGAVPFALPAAVRCVIAFSPYAGFTGAPWEHRYEGIHVPVLSVTSLEDRDPHALVSTPALRRVPFDHMPPGQKYLLSMVGAPHALFAGSDAPPAGGLATGDEMPQPRAGGGNPSDGDGRGTGRPRGGRGGGTGGRRGGDYGENGNGPSSLRPISGAAWTEALGRVQSVTIAYLDADLEQDSVGSEWLAKDARRWLGDEADFIVK